ncbi:hypothetical protein KP509_1Z082200 [Ceratopteris richardii]|nr:hypothetical protein KP509_1Z082200 [Ceratopteris richardii]
MLTGTQKVRELPDAIHDNKDHPVNTGHSEQRNGELGSLNRYQISKDDQCSLPHVGQHEVQTERSQLERKSDSSELNLAVESPGNPDFDSRVSVDEATETRKRLTLIPYQDHIYPSAQSSARSLNSRGPSWALVVRDSLPYVKVPMVPSWREIKRPMMFTSSSDTDAASSSDTHTSSSIGELQQKALTILRKSAPTSFARNNAAEENSEGEVAAASKMRSNSRSLSGDLEQGEIITRKSSRSSAPNLHGIETRSSSEGEMSLGRLDPEELA